MRIQFNLFVNNNFFASAFPLAAAKIQIYMLIAAECCIVDT